MHSLLKQVIKIALSGGNCPSVEAAVFLKPRHVNIPLGPIFAKNSVNSR